MKKIAFTLSFFLMLMHASGQLYFIHGYESNHSTFGSKIACNAQNELAMGLWVNNYQSCDPLLFIKTNVNGYPLSTKYFFSGEITGLTTANTGGYFITTHCAGDHTATNTLTKVDEDGNVQWCNKTYYSTDVGGNAAYIGAQNDLNQYFIGRMIHDNVSFGLFDTSGTQIGYYALSINNIAGGTIYLQPGKIILAGSQHDYGELSRGIILSLDTVNNVYEGKYFSMPGKRVGLGAIKKTNHAYIVSGSISDSISPTINQEYFLMKLDENLQVQWTTAFPAYSYNSIVDIAVDTSGITTGIVAAFPSLGFGTRLLKADASGNFMSLYKTDSVYAQCIVNTQDGLAIGGYSMADNKPVIEKIDRNYGYACYLSADTVSFHSINFFETPLTCNLQSMPVYGFSPSAFSQKDTLVNDYAICEQLMRVPSFSVSVYPNPANEGIKIQQTILQYMRYEISDLQGRPVKKGTLFNLNETVQTSSFQSGLYFLQLADNNYNGLTKKVVIVH